MLFNFLNAIDTPTDDFTGEAVDVETRTDFPIEFLIICILVLCIIIFFYILSLNKKIDKLSQKKDNDVEIK